MQTEATIEERAIATIASFFCRSPYNITANTNFSRDLGVEYLLEMLCLREWLERELNVTIKPSDANFQTVGDVLQYLRTCAGPKPQTQQPNGG
ncbi:MAG: acyl carrier protein [Patescibacteria group bacterium]|nr:acyl carrier protein [Patescibacteria group bacterium]